MPTNFERAYEVSKQVEIREVLLRKASMETRLHPTSPPASLSINTKYRAKHDLPEGRDAEVHVYADFRLDIAGEDDGSEEEGVGDAHLEATFLAIYTVADNRESLSEDALIHFAELNGVYNLWPYWRELVSTVSGRIGLGGLMVPVFVPQRRELEEPDEEDEEMEADDGR